MEMERITFRAPGALKDAAEKRAKRLGFSNFSEYLRHCMREDIPTEEIEWEGEEVGDAR